MLAQINSFALVGLDAELIVVEVDITRGLPGLAIVGLPDKAVEESRERVRSAIGNVGASFPVKKIIVNLAPADIKKVGPAYDLAIALGILIADQQLLSVPGSDVAIIGELALDGKVRPVNGVLAIALSAVKFGIGQLFVPADNAQEAAMIDGLKIYPVDNLKQLLDHFNGIKMLSAQPIQILQLQQDQDTLVDFADIKGQHQAKRALEIAAAGAHNILMSGPPGSGKTFLAKALGSILPPLTKQEILETTKIYSVAGLLTAHQGLITKRPVRTPHHTASAIALTGGGSWPRPGEISLAHRGVLFLDELPEFPRSVLEVLRQPLEDGVITVSRAHGSITFPAQFMLVASQNPCPCGHLGSNKCICSPSSIIRYRRKISGPFLDRIDLSVHVGSVEYHELTTTNQAESSDEIRQRVIAARTKQRQRFGNRIQANAEMDNRLIKQYCQLDEEAQNIMKTAIEHYNISARVYYRILKLARTIADLADQEAIKSVHIAEAIQYRPQMVEIS